MPDAIWGNGHSGWPYHLRQDSHSYPYAAPDDGPARPCAICPRNRRAAPHMEGSALLMRQQVAQVHMGHWVHVSCRRLRLPREDVMKHNSACHHEAPWAAVFEHTVGAAVAQVKQGSFSSRLQILQFGQSWKPGCSCSPALMSTCSPEIPGRMPTSLHATALSTPLCRSSGRACPHAQPLLSQLGTQKTGITLGASDSGL